MAAFGFFAFLAFLGFCVITLVPIKIKTHKAPQNDRLNLSSMTNLMFRIYSLIYEKFLLAQWSVLVFCIKFNVQVGAGKHVSHLS